MTYLRSQRVALLAGLGGLTMAQPALAEMIWYHGQWIDSRHLASWQIEDARQANAAMAAMRIGMMLASTIIGFALGWFFSPAGAWARRLILLGLVLLLGGVALFNPGPTGWGAAGLTALVGFAWGLGYWLGQAVKAMMHPPTTFGSAQWATKPHLASKGLLDSTGITLGTVGFHGSERTLVYGGERHLFTFAPTRSGKGVSHIVPNLLSHQGSVMVIDVKGENLLITGQARADMGQEVMAFDPWNIAAADAGFTPMRINPMNWINLPDPDAPENAMMLAESLVVKNPKSDPFWAEEAKALIRGLILLVAFDQTYDDKRHLGTVRDLLLLSGEDQSALFAYMAESPHALIASTGARFLQKDEKLLSNVMASAQAETHILDSERVRDALSKSDFDFADLKTKPLSIFLIIPADRVETFSRLLRLLVQQANRDLFRMAATTRAKPSSHWAF